MATIKKVKKYQNSGPAIKQEFYNPRNKNGAVGKTIEADTSGYSAGAKKFPMKVTTSRGTSSGTTSRKQVDKMIKNPKITSFGVKAKKGGSFDLNKDGKTTFKDVLIGRGVLPKTAKKGTKVKKAQDGYKYSLPKPMVGTVSADTSGFSAGKKSFPAKITSPNGKTTSGNVPRRIIKKEIEKTTKQRMGGKTKKCAYGCK